MPLEMELEEHREVLAWIRRQPMTEKRQRAAMILFYRICEIEAELERAAERKVA
jgi:hypothetical protein